MIEIGEGLMYGYSVIKTPFAGKRHRTREILTLPGPGGRSCPHLSETQACEPESCFRWRVTYGPCEATPRGGCGQGTRQRFAECVNREEVRSLCRVMSCHIVSCRADLWGEGCWVFLFCFVLLLF